MGRFSLGEWPTGRGFESARGRHGWNGQVMMMAPSGARETDRNVQEGPSVSAGGAGAGHAGLKWQIPGHGVTNRDTVATVNPTVAAAIAVRVSAQTPPVTWK